MNKKIIKLVKEWTENNIDISKEYDQWITFLKKNGYLMSYKEVYEMDLDYLISNKDTNYWNEDKQEWDVESLITDDNDIEKINDNLFFVHRQEYIDNDIINDFYEEQNLDWAINQAYINLKESSNAFSRFDALLFIFGHDFGSQKLYFASDMDKVKKESLKCMKSVVNLIDDNIYDGSIELWLPNHNVWSDAEDEHYCELIMFGGYEILSDGQKILDSDAIILKDEESIRTLEYFTYQNINELCDYIAEVFEFYKNDVFNVDDVVYEQLIHQKLNEIIDNYWMNTIEFDYAEFYNNKE